MKKNPGKSLIYCYFGCNSVKLGDLMVFTPKKGLEFARGWKTIGRYASNRGRKLKAIFSKLCLSGDLWGKMGEREIDVKPYGVRE